MAEPITFRWRAPGRIAIGRAARRRGPTWARGALSGAAAMQMEDGLV